ncbi:MAG: hypothetical protein JWP57_2051 [Spirosoma sp.]|nr:hypothetical protein [Spirosoma sp.]
MTHLSHPHGSLSVMLIALAFFLIPILIHRYSYPATRWQLVQVAGFMVGVVWLVIRYVTRRLLVSINT